MSYASEHPTVCAECPASVPHSKWHHIKAQGEGWFFSYQEDKAYCPKHVPKWVAGWRARRDQKPVECYCGARRMLNSKGRLPRHYSKGALCDGSLKLPEEVACGDTRANA